MKSSIPRVAAILAVLAALGGCVVYDPYYPYGPPGGYPAGPNTFDRSWAAAVGALGDQGVQITNQDRASGTIDGQRGNVTIKTRVTMQADGKTRVEFNTGGALSEDPGLPDRISRSYDVRMGR